MGDVHKLIIIGSGPSGYAAGIYAARAQLKPLLFAGEKSGGQLMLTTEVENYPGFPEGVLGPELMMRQREQAERFGTKILDQFVTRVDFSAKPFKVYAGNPLKAGEEQEFLAEAVILATGAEAILLEVPGEMDYLGRGVSTCAVCDAAFYRDKNVYVVGGGDAAMEDTLALTKFAKKITVIHRRDSFRASKIMQDRVLKDHADKVEVWWNTRVVAVAGDGQKIGSIMVEDVVKGEAREVEAEGLFIAIGHRPATGFLKGAVELDDKGYVVTRLGLGKLSLKLAGEHLNEEGILKFPTMTSVEGVFGAGDNVDFRYRQAATAAGFGVMAALDAEWWLERQ